MVSITNYGVTVITNLDNEATDVANIVFSVESLWISKETAITEASEKI